MSDITIGEFAKLTRCTSKTILYYHKIGLLQTPRRSTNGYRIYGAEEMARMSMIQHLKGFGLDLTKIKEILGDAGEPHNLGEFLSSWKQELIREKVRIEMQLLKVDELLRDTLIPIEQATFHSDTFQEITKILEPIQEAYKIRESPEAIQQHHKAFGIIEDFQWGDQFKENLHGIAQYFKEHPNDYQRVVAFGERLAALRTMAENDPDVERLAREGSEFIKAVPELKEMLYGQIGLGESKEQLMDDMAKQVLSPAQMRHKALIQKYLNYKGTEDYL